MTSTADKPILYMKKGCSYCSKVAIFLSDAGIREIAATWDYDIDVARGDITAQLGKASFPCLKTLEGEYILESDVIIARFAAEYNVDMESLESYRFIFQEGNDDPSFWKTFRKLAKYGVENAGGQAELAAKLAAIEL